MRSNSKQRQETDSKLWIYEKELESSLTLQRDIDRLCQDIQQSETSKILSHELKKVSMMAAVTTHSNKMDSESELGIKVRTVERVIGCQGSNTDSGCSSGEYQSEQRQVEERPRGVFRSADNYYGEANRCIQHGVGYMESLIDGFVQARANVLERKDKHQEKLLAMTFKCGHLEARLNELKCTNRKEHAKFQLLQPEYKSLYKQYLEAKQVLNDQLSLLEEEQIRHSLQEAKDQDLADLLVQADLKSAELMHEIAQLEQIVEEERMLSQNAESEKRLDEGRCFSSFSNNSRREKLLIESESKKSCLQSERKPLNCSRNKEPTFEEVIENRIESISPVVSSKEMVTIPREPDFDISSILNCFEQEKLQEDAHKSGQFDEKAQTELSDNRRLHVIIRIWQSSEHSQLTSEPEARIQQRTANSLYLPVPRHMIKSSNFTQGTEFRFDNLFAEGVSQERFCEAFDPCINRLFAGKTECFVNFSSSGSSAEFNTLFGSDKGASTNGVFGRVIDLIYERAGKFKDVEIRALKYFTGEMSNDKLVDLESRKETEVIKLTNFQGKSSNDLISALKESQSRRNTAQGEQGPINRGHLVLVIEVIMMTNRGLATGSLLFLDMAGLEGALEESKEGPKERKERLFIAKSSSCMRDLLTAIAEKREHLPFRNSRLTSLVQKYMQGNLSKIVVLVNLGLAERSYNQTRGLLDFALTLQQGEANRSKNVHQNSRHGHTESTNF